jgi:hypothetical protein
MAQDKDKSEKSVLEKRQDERVVAKLNVRFTRLSEEELRKDLEGGAYRDVFSSANLGDDDGSAADDTSKAFTANVSVSGLKLIGDLRLTGGEPLTEGMALRVGIEFAEASQVVTAIARVIWSTPADQAGKFTAGLFFEGINKADVDKMARFVILQKRAQMGR